MSRLEKIQSMLAESPDDAFLRYAYAMELSKQDDLPAARAAFASVRDIAPEYVPAYFQEGQLLAREGLVAEAQTILQQGIAVAGRTGDQHAEGEMREFLESL